MYKRILIGRRGGEADYVPPLMPLRACLVQFSRSRLASALHEAHQVPLIAFQTVGPAA
jgi:hypothetical protein